MRRDGGGRGRGFPLPRAAGRAWHASRPEPAPSGQLNGGRGARVTVALRFRHGGKVMRTRSLLMLAVAVVALTVVSGRTARAQASCNVDTDCDFCNSETCTGNVCVPSGAGDPCASGLEC